MNENQINTLHGLIAAQSDYIQAARSELRHAEDRMRELKRDLGIAIEANRAAWQRDLHTRFVNP